MQQDKQKEMLFDYNSILPDGSTAVLFIFAAIIIIIFVSMVSVMAGIVIVLYQIAIEHGVLHTDSHSKKKAKQNNTPAAEQSTTNSENSETQPKEHKSENDAEPATSNAKQSKSLEEQFASLINRLIIANTVNLAIVGFLMVNIVLHTCVTSLEGIIRTWDFAMGGIVNDACLSACTTRNVAESAAEAVIKSRAEGFMPADRTPEPAQ